MYEVLIQVENRGPVGKEENRRFTIKFRGVKNSVTAIHSPHCLMHRGMLVHEEANITLVSEVMANSA